MFVRRPVDRVVSGFHHSMHDCRSLQARHGCDEDSDHDTCNRNANFTEYAQCVRGCTARMLTGHACGDTDVTVATQPTLASDAVRVMRNHVGFVGMTEHWAASVCLFHARFGGECVAAELSDVRPGGYTPDTSLDADWPGDAVDETVFDAATEIFWSQVAAHHLDAEVCARVCPRVSRAYFDHAVYTRAEAAQR